MLQLIPHHATPLHALPLVILSGCHDLPLIHPCMHEHGDACFDAIHGALHGLLAVLVPFTMFESVSTLPTWLISYGQSYQMSPPVHD